MKMMTCGNMLDTYIDISRVIWKTKLGQNILCTLPHLNLTFVSFCSEIGEQETHKNVARDFSSLPGSTILKIRCQKKTFSSQMSCAFNFLACAFRISLTWSVF